MGMFNPEMMKNLMGNEEIQKMMNDPSIMNNIQNMMGNGDILKNMGIPNIPDLNGACTDGACPDGACPDGACPDGACSDGACPDGACPDGACPDGACSDGACPDGDTSDINIENLEDITIEESRINVGDKVLTQNLKNADYNDKKGIVEDMLENGRFVIKFEDERVAAIKDENLVNRFENIENID